MLNQVEAGVKAAKAAVTLMPNSGDAQLLLGVLFIKSNILLEKKKNSAEAEAEKALLLAEKALLSAKKLYKNPNPEVHYQLARLYTRTKRNKEAADELATYLKVKPDLSSKEKKFTLDLIDKLRKTP